MLHSRFLSTRFLLAASSFLAVSSVGLGLPQRGAAQDDMTRRPAAPSVSTGGTLPGGGTNADNGSTGSGDGSPDEADNGNTGNGGDSAVGADGGANPNPSVGVDNAGSAGAVGTRSGRTNRQRRRVTPPNPLVLRNPTRGSGPGTVGDGGDTGGNRAAPLVPPREPGDFTLQTNPFQPRLRPGGRPLPLFGYDFFQPARQIIIARRRALLPRPVRQSPAVPAQGRATARLGL